jgi:hypothetical protein
MEEDRDNGEATVNLNGQQVTQEQLNEEKSNLKNNERIVEVADKTGEFKTVKRMQG